jgi:hypothetical protein
MSQKITEFTRANVRSLMDEVEEVLKPLAEKHGLVLDRKGKSFYRDSVPAMFQFLVRVEDEDGNALDSKAQEFKKNATRVGLKADDLGREFQSRGETFKVTGLNLRARKYPVLAENVRTGKVYKFHQDTVKRGFDRVILP